jgi:hypothetical protein
MRKACLRSVSCSWGKNLQEGNIMDQAAPQIEGYLVSFLVFLFLILWLAAQSFFRRGR